MSEWRARLVDLLIRRYSDAQALRHAAQLRLGDELASELPGGASLKVLATEVVLACQRRGTVETLLLCLRSEAGASDPELDALCDEHVVAHAGPQLQAAIAAHCEHARLIARRPRVDALVHTLMDAPALDLERVFVAPRVRTIDSPAESMQWRERTEPGGIARPSAARPLLAVWPEPSAWLLVLGGPGSSRSSGSTPAARRSRRRSAARWSRCGARGWRDRAERAGREGQACGRRCCRRAAPIRRSTRSRRTTWRPSGRRCCACTS